MDRIELKSFAKINLTLDVKGTLPGGMHEVEMVMQQILLCDDVSITWEPAAGGLGQTAETGGIGQTETGGLEINLTTNRKYLPTDERNLAYKAVQVMHRYCRQNPHIYTAGQSAPVGRVAIHIKKRIPVAAGLAGGSGNGAAVLHGLNVLWGLNLDLKTLCEISTMLGSDVPFTVMGQAAANENLKGRFAGDPLACHCALATGTGTELKPLPGLKSHLVLSKPPVSVSTASVYKGIDNVQIPQRPDTEEMIEGLRKRDRRLIEKNLINVLENYTLKEYSNVVYTKNKMQELCNSGAVLMSGSGPTVFGLCDSIQESRAVCDAMKQINPESFWTRTTC